jgi:hypothetical protein
LPWWAAAVAMYLLDPGMARMDISMVYIDDAGNVALPGRWYYAVRVMSLTKTAAAGKSAVPASSSAAADTRRTMRN